MYYIPFSTGLKKIADALDIGYESKFILKDGERV
jgi:hypothetical protein